MTVDRKREIAMRHQARLIEAIGPERHPLTEATQGRDRRGQNPQIARSIAAQCTRHHALSQSSEPISMTINCRWVLPADPNLTFDLSDRRRNVVSQGRNGDGLLRSGPDYLRRQEKEGYFRKRTARAYQLESRCLARHIWRRHEALHRN
jgi:hypothetical protein